MENRYKRSVYFFDSLPRVQNFFIPRFSGGVTTGYEHPQESRRACDYKDGKFVFARNESDRPGERLSEPLSFPNICCSEALGGLRVILNLKQINLFIPPQHFRMETLPAVLPQLTADDWAVTIDLKDAYLHVPMNPEPHRLLGFQYLNQTFLYQVLPLVSRIPLGFSPE